MWWTCRRMCMRAWGGRAGERACEHGAVCTSVQVHAPTELLARASSSHIVVTLGHQHIAVMGMDAFAPPVPPVLLYVHARELVLRLGSPRAGRCKNRRLVGLPRMCCSHALDLLRVRLCRARPRCVASRAARQRAARVPPPPTLRPSRLWTRRPSRGIARTAAACDRVVIKETATLTSTARRAHSWRHRSAHCKPTASPPAAAAGDGTGGGGGEGSGACGRLGTDRCCDRRRAAPARQTTAADAVADRGCEAAARRRHAWWRRAATVRTMGRQRHTGDRESHASAHARATTANGST
eukprot:365725-Chlamydomonas_euryale.AAC.5